MAIRAEREGGKTWEVPAIGDVVAGKYRILEVLGRGGLAIVLSAMHIQLEQRVAIKFLLPEWTHNEEVVTRFQREGRAAIKIRSEHVVRVLDVDTLPSGAPYIVMEYLEGTDLAALVEYEGPLPVTTAVDYVLQACEAIAEAHAAGIIHRDLKPANLFLTTRADGSECVKVLDFGISKNMSPRASELNLTSPEAVMGSPHYMSPEQLQSTASVDERSDIWALGAILHELLSGDPPFRGNTGPQVCVNVMYEPPAPLTDTRPDVPDALEATVLLCLEKEASRRFSNVGELALALANFGPPERAHASADTTVRVLQSGGIIETSPSRLWPSQPPTKVTEPPTTEPDDFRLKARSPTVVTSVLLLGLAAIFGGWAYARHAGYFMYQYEPQTFTPAGMPNATAEPAAPIAPPKHESAPRRAVAPEPPKAPTAATASAATTTETIAAARASAAPSDTAPTGASAKPPAPLRPLPPLPPRTTRAFRYVPAVLPRATTPPPEPTTVAPSPTSASPNAPPATTKAPAPATAPTATSPNGLFEDRK